MKETVHFNKEKGITTVVLDTEEGRFVGMSHCQDCDTFDEEVGRKIAKSRALIKLHSLRVDNLMRSKKAYANICDEDANLIRRRIKDLSQHIKNLSK